MGDIKRKRKAYVRPRNLFDRKRIDEEDMLIKNYGLKNKREIWKAKSVVSKFRRRAKDLISQESEKQRDFFEKLTNLGLKSITTSDVLALTEKDLLNRRLQTFVFKKELANSPKQARQLIVHKHITVDGKIVNIPSFWITSKLENKIEVIPFKIKDHPVEEILPEESENEKSDDSSKDENKEASE